MENKETHVEPSVNADQIAQLEYDTTPQPPSDEPPYDIIRDKDDNVIPTKREDWHQLKNGGWVYDPELG